MSEEQVKKGRGCFFYGCLTLVVVVLIGMLGLYFGTRYAINKVIDRYTDASPVALPKVEVTQAEATAIQERVNAFKTALESGKAAEPLTLTEKELNALIAYSPDFAQLKDKVYLSLVGEQIKGEVSIPLDQFPLGRAKGRYVNGSAAFGVSLANGVLIVTLQSLQVKGQAIPEQMLAGMRGQNLAENAYKEVKTAELLQKLEKIEVRDGKLTISPRPPQ